MNQQGMGHDTFGRVVYCVASEESRDGTFSLNMIFRICWTDDLSSCFLSCFQLSVLVRSLRSLQIKRYWSLGKVTSHLGQW